MRLSRIWAKKCLSKVWFSKCQKLGMFWSYEDAINSHGIPSHWSHIHMIFSPLFSLFWEARGKSCLIRLSHAGPYWSNLCWLIMTQRFQLNKTDSTNFFKSSNRQIKKQFANRNPTYWSNSVFIYFISLSPTFQTFFR